MKISRPNKKLKANAPLGMAEMQRVISEVIEKLKEEGTKAALVGGFAMHAYGSNRLTSDVDLLVEKPPAFAEEGDPLSIGGVSVEVDNVTVDFIDGIGDEYHDLYQEGLRTAKQIPGQPAPVVRPEVLVAMKMLAGRPKDDTDLYYLLSSVDLNQEYLKKVITKFLGRYALKDLQNTAEMAKFLKTSGRL